jgi:Polyketide cyclase / dehydrase and lipid transport
MKMFNNKLIIKIMKTTFFFLVLSFGLFSTLYATDDLGWKETKNQNGITVLTRSIAGSGFKEFKAKVEVKATQQEVIDLILNFDSYPNWMYNYTTCNLLKKNSASEYLYYAVVSAPFPVSSRDAIINCNVTNASDKTVITLSAAPTFLPLKNGKVRMSKFSGEWEVKPLKDGLVEIVCQLHVEPGGSVPKWLSNMFVSDGPYTTFLNMKNMLAKK